MLKGSSFLFLVTATETKTRQTYPTRIELPRRPTVIIFCSLVVSPLAVSCRKPLTSILYFILYQLSIPLCNNFQIFSSNFPVVLHGKLYYPLNSRTVLTPASIHGEPHKEFSTQYPLQSACRIPCDEPRFCQRPYRAIEVAPPRRVVTFSGSSPFEFCKRFHHRDCFFHPMLSF